MQQEVVVEENGEEEEEEKNDEEKYEEGVVVDGDLIDGVVFVNGSEVDEEWDTNNEGNLLV